MNINVNVRNKKILVEKLRGYTYKVSYTSADYYLDYKTWYQINVEPLPFDQND